jgi:diguanylate cyclase (GGDEF)-like protein
VSAGVDGSERPGGRLGSEAELRALVELASAVAGAERPEVVLDAAANACVDAMGVSSVSFGRWHPEERAMRILVNAGWLAPGEERHPADERWTVDEYPLVARLVDARQPYVVDAESSEPSPERDLLQRLGGGSVLAVPVVVGDAVWGEIEAFAAPDRPPLTPAQVALFEAVAVQVAAALGRAEHFARVSSLAFEDPLTGLPNRRAAEERIAAAVRAAAPEHPVSVMFADLDGLKEVNDRLGHGAGDEALRAVGSELAAAAAEVPGAVAARLGGDEFCVLLVGAGAEEGRALARRVRGRLAARRPPLALSFGAVTRTEPPARVADVLRAADAAQYAAKRAGGGRLYVAEEVGERTPDPPPAPPARRHLRDAPHPDRGALVREVLALLDGPQALAGPADRLEALGATCAARTGLAAWVVLRRPAGERELRTVLFGARRTGDAPELRFRTPEARIPLALLPGAAGAIAGGAFSLVTDAPELDPRARQIFAEGGWVAGAGAGATAADGDGWLLVLLADDPAAPLAAVLPELRLFVREAVHGARMGE